MNEVISYVIEYTYENHLYSYMDETIFIYREFIPNPEMTSMFVLNKEKMGTFRENEERKIQY